MTTGLVTRPRFTAGRRDSLTATAFVVPSILVFGLLLGAPLVQVVLLSFQQDTLGPVGAPVWTTENYADTVTSPVFWASLGRTFIHAGGSVLLATLLGMGAALLLFKPIKLRKLYRVLLIIPWTIPGVVAALDWRLLFDLRVGLIPYAGSALGITPADFPWLGSPEVAMTAVTIAQSWRAFPFMMLFILAGLQSIPAELYEASSLDGAGAWGQFRNITLPGVAGVTAAAAALNFVLTARYFDLIYVMTGGGPGDSTEVAATLIYRNAFRYFTPGHASAIAVITAILVVAIYLIIRTTRRLTADRQL